MRTRRTQIEADRGVMFAQEKYTIRRFGSAVWLGKRVAGQVTWVTEGRAVPFALGRHLPRQED